MSSKNGSRKDGALAILSVMTKLISDMTEEEFDALSAGRATLAVLPSEDASPCTKRKLPQLKAGELDLDKLRDELSTVESTEAALSIFETANLTRRQLERIARSLDLPVLKQDSTTRLEEKIIEAMVGSRLNSRAVRGK